MQQAIQNAVPWTNTNTALYSAFLGRRVGDRVVGYALSGKAGKALQVKGISVGRVQSPAVALVVQREQEIRKFKQKTSWQAVLQLGEFDAEHVQSYNTKEEAEKAIARMKQAGQAIVKSIKIKKVATAPKPPFTTVDMQAVASVMFGWGPEQTQKVAQDLFSAGLVTYIRTDAYTLAEEWTVPMQEWCRLNVSEDSVPDKPVVYKSKQSQAEAHEAIRPVSAGPLKDVLAGARRENVDDDCIGLLEVIWHRAVASQMVPMIREVTTVELEVAGEKLVATGDVLISEGFRRVWTYGTLKQSVLPPMDNGAAYTVFGGIPKEKKTKPQGRYSEASLLKELEKRGVGRPSTYAMIIKTIKDRGYVVVKDKMLRPTETGERLVAWLRESHPWVVDCGFTAEMELQLDNVVERKAGWKDVVREIVSRVGGMPGSYVQTQADNARATSRPLSEKQIAVINRHGDDIVKKALEDKSYPTCRAWLDKFFKELKAGKK